MRIVDHALNALLLIIAGVFIFRLASTTAPVTRAESLTPLLKVGDTVEWAEVSGPASTGAVLLVMRETCPACEASAPFYRVLAEETRVAGLKFVVATLGDYDASVAWLERHEIAHDEVVRLAGALDKGIVMVPTLMLISSSGTISSLLLRKLSADEEEALLLNLRLENPRVLDNTRYPTEIVFDDLDSLTEAETLTLDIRDRDEAVAAPPPRPALNIPLDELVTRAPWEISRTVAVVVACPAMTVVACRTAGRELRDLGWNSVYVAFPRNAFEEATR